MSTVAGIDCGGTNTHGVIMDGKVIARKCEIPGNSEKEAAECFRCVTGGVDISGLKVAVTGGGARKITRARLIGMSGGWNGKEGGGHSGRRRKVEGRVHVRASPAGRPGAGGGGTILRVDEIEAIGKGGVFLSGKRDVFVVSMGTGTAFVSVRGGKAAHAGGTGIGGGTVRGLSSIMLGTDPDSAERMAKKALYALDLTVKDIVGKGIGSVLGSVTVANFGRAHAGRISKEEISGSMLRMVAESVGVMSYFAAKSAGQERHILLCGRVAINDIVKKRILYTIGMFGGVASVPRNAEYCAAIGAALSV